jgi:hypothetical protein
MPEETREAALGLRQQRGPAMSLTTLDANTFATALIAAFDDPELNLYAIVDSAQDSGLLETLSREMLSTDSVCILPAARDSDIERSSPHLVALSPVAADGDSWPDILQGGAAHPPSLTLLASHLELDELSAHLETFSEIILPDDTEMIFAFWDPAILGTLTGQSPDTTLHVPGPIFSETERSRFLNGVNAWWYWDRFGNPQSIKVTDEPLPHEARFLKLPLKLAQQQVDLLIEAGVPDQIMSYIKENQPQLLDDILVSERYPLMQVHLHDARKLGLLGMQDIVNYTCAALIYGDAFGSDATIKSLLAQVKAGELSFDQALEQFPDNEIAGHV